MNLAITKSAKQFGYLIWNNKQNNELEQLLNGRDSVQVIFNGFNLGVKNVDRKYHRISLGFKLTRALPEAHNMYSIDMNDGVLEVKSFDGNNC